MAIDHYDENPNRPNDPFADKRIEATKKGFFGFFITRYRLTFIMLVALVMMGTVALIQIPREADPEVKIPIAVVTTIFPGASPSDIEDLVTDKIETKLENLEDVKLIESQSRLGISSVVVEFQAEADLEESVNDLKDAVDEVSGLPDEAEDPFVTEIRANDFPLISFSIAGVLSDAQLKELGELIQDELENIPGVSEAPLLGARNREFSVTINREAINRLGLPLNVVVGAISRSNTDTPLGSITIDSIDYNLRTVAKFTSLDDLKKVVISIAPDDSPIFLEDIAKVEDILSERSSISRISLHGEPPVNTVSLQVFKKTGGNIIEVVDRAKERVSELQNEGVVPENVQVEVSSDFSQFIRDDLNTLGRSGLQAAALIFIVILLALSFKEALISLFAIPLTFLITFTILNARGDTMNSLTLFALVLSLGLLVDTFIVILEGIFHNMRRGYGSRDASLLSVAHYKKPLFSGVFTTIAAFIPMLLVSGILGEFLKVLPITISITLLSSLFVSFIIVPSFAAVFMRRRSPEEKKKESPLERYVTNWLREKYRASIARFLRSGKKKVIFTSVVTILFFGSIASLATGVIPVELFPRVDVDFGYIDVEMPIGTDLSATDMVVQPIEGYLSTRSDIKSFVTTVGQSSSFGIGGVRTTNTEHRATINVNYVDLKDRSEKSYIIADEIRDDLSFIKEGRITIREISGGPPTGAPIEVRISGDELSVLSQIAEQLIEELKATDGVIDIESNEEVSPADLTFTLDREALTRAGLSISEVSGFLRTAIFGVTATEVTIDGEDVDVIVKFDIDTITSVEEIKNISLINSRGKSVKLSRIADFSLQPALATIRHRDFDRTISVQANLEPGFTATGIVPDVQQRMDARGIPSGYTLDFGGEVEDIEQSFSELWSALIVAVLLIVIILILQFDSFVKPFVILMAFPLIIVGVTVGVFIMRLPFSFSVFLGIVALVGIGVNDAIVLLDKAGRNTEEKKLAPIDAVADAGDSRLQPILLTSITTIIGVVPLAFADEFWLGMSVSIVFGLAFATIMQLYIIPMFYVKFVTRLWRKQQKTLALAVTEKKEDDKAIPLGI